MMHNTRIASRRALWCWQWSMQLPGQRQWHQGQLHSRFWQCLNALAMDHADGIPGRMAYIQNKGGKIKSVVASLQGFVVLAMEHADGTASAVQLPDGRFKYYGGWPPKEEGRLAQTRSDFRHSSIECLKVLLSYWKSLCHRSLECYSGSWSSCIFKRQGVTTSA